MNIKNRIKKLEVETASNSDSCACFPQRNFEQWHADLSKDSNTSEPVLKSDPVPDVCPDCGKPIEKNQIIIQFCDNTTKDRFPEEWQASGHK